MSAPTFKWDDGGRADAGFKGEAPVIYTFDADSEFLNVDMMGGINYRGNAPDKTKVVGKKLKH